MNKFILSVIVISFISTALANTESLYAGQETREIKALSQQEVADYLDGKGLGYAKAAELNNYPGPRHALDLASELNLTEEQTLLSQALFEAMKSQASTLGRQYIAKEKELELGFSSNSLDASSLESLVSEIGVIQSNIRYVHLSAHLKQKALLTEKQIQLYNQLRGYVGLQNNGHNHSH